MSELNPDFRDDNDQIPSDAPDIGDLKAVHAYLEDATLDDAARLQRADVVERLENERGSKNRKEVTDAIGKARGQGAPAEDMRPQDAKAAQGERPEPRTGTSTSDKSSSSRKG
jgi:hypothetical protein